MAEPEREPTEEQKPLTREHVLRLIEQHGGSEDLDLRKAELEDIDLSRLDLHGVRLYEANLQGANLSWANLQGARVPWANLQGADLQEANLQGADLYRANLQGTDLIDANLQGASLISADLRRASLSYASLRDANLEGANWGDYVLGEEIAQKFDHAAPAYRAPKQRHTEAGMYDIAGEFHYREMEVRRKLAWEERRLPYALGMYSLRLLYGYGERPERVIASAAGILLLFTAVHGVFGTVAGGFLDALYYSAVSFTALGYGAWAPEPQGWAGRFLGVGEALMGVFMMGVFMMALFLVTFTRKMTR